MSNIFHKRANFKGGSGTWRDFTAVLYRAQKPNTDTHMDIAECHRSLQEYFRSGNVYTFGAARMGLYESLRALKIGSGDEVILPGYTCAVVVNSVRFLGATPVFVDIELNSLGIDNSKLEQAINNRTKAIVAHHLFGIPSDITGTISIGNKHNIPTIEDAAMAFGGTLNNQPLGSFGAASIISCERTKVISTVNGGVLIVHDADLDAIINSNYEQIGYRPYPYSKLNLQQWLLTYLVSSPSVGAFSDKIIRQIRKLRSIRNKPWKFDFETFDLKPMYQDEYAGSRQANYPFRLSNDQAWLLNRQLKDLDKQIRHRNELAVALEPILRNRGAGLPKIDWSIMKPAWLRFPFWVDDPDSWRSKLEKLDIQCGDWFTGPIHPIECASNPEFQYPAGSCPNGEWLGKHILNIPLTPRIGTWLVNRLKKL